LCKQLTAQERPDSTNNAGKEKFEVQLFFVDAPCFNPMRCSLTNIFAPLHQPFAPQHFIKSLLRPPCFTA
jgi:hypothetical protein